MIDHIKKGVDFKYIHAEKFKTNTISVFFNIPLQENTVTKAALLPMVMKRGTENHRTMIEISQYLDELYSATFRTGVRPKGDGEVLYFTVEYIRDKYTEKNITEKIIDLLKEFIFKPLCDDGGFDEKYLESEKENLKNAINGLINDKREYAEFKCREAMFEGRGFGMFELGFTEDLPKIDRNNLYDFYRTVRDSAKVDVFASGEFSDGGIKKIKEELCCAFCDRKADYIESDVISPRGEKPEKIVDEISMVQSKLCIGLSTGIDTDSNLYYPLVLGNCVFGGSPFSKLFNNVREKLSLAYYASSRFEQFKGALFVSCGIETEKFEAAYDEIMAQLSNMKNGEIEIDEIENAKRYMNNRLTSMKDGLYSMEDYYLSQTILNNSCEIDEMIDRLNNVTKDEIITAFNKVKVDVVYFLKGGDGQ